jgi:putative colanic acid biosynthesis acetyltransferase WcaF
MCSRFFFNTSLPWPYKVKSLILKLFGAKVGDGLIVKPHVTIKYPWFLDVGNHVWFGEGAWIDNLARVQIGDQVCISQGAYLMTGNHDYSMETFDLRLGPIVIEDGAWVGAKAIVGPGVTMKSHSVLTAGSVANHNTEAYKIYQGNPAQMRRERVIR